MATKIVGISGKRGAGKTTMADYMVERYGFKRVSFASKLKDISCSLFPFKPINLTTKGKERPFAEYDWTPREFMISFGQFMRYYDPEYWVKGSKIDSMVGKIVIDDLRFPNEADYLKSLGAKFIRLERYEHLNVYGKNLDDPSETSLDTYSFDYTVEACRNVSIEDLKKQTDYALTQVGVF